MFVTTLDLAHADALKALLEEQNFELAQPAYTLFVGKKKGITCALYASGKLVVQGKESPSFIEFYLEPQVLQKFDFTHAQVLLDSTPRIGIDEAGKGDVFGPLCVAGVFATSEQIHQLQKIGVKDSKNINDSKIAVLAKEIQQLCLHHIIPLFPRKYNELYQNFGNLNSMLAWGHATAIENIVQKSQCNKVIVDQFAAEYVVLNALKRKKIVVELTQRHRAEEDLVVAAASILARAAFLEGLKSLGDRVQMMLPKGAAAQTVTTGQKLVEKYGPDILMDLIKLHFKTTQAILRQNPGE